MGLETEDIKQFEIRNSDMPPDTRGEEGRQEGETPKAIEMAKAMLADNEPLDKIARYTALTREQIEALQQ